MLRKLSVVNYALIDELKIELTPGLSIITGETGSGKSILLGALSLILGKRADTSVLQDKSRKCIVEGEFDISEYGFSDFFDKNELDYESTSILRREISESGKSRAFINDTPVSLNILRDMGTRLVDIHSQHTNLLLSGSRFQLDVIDAFAGNSSILESYRAAFQTYAASLELYNNLKDKADQAGSDLEYHQFQLDQLVEAALAGGEQQELEEELELLMHAGEIGEALDSSCYLLHKDELSIISRLKMVLAGTGKIEQFFPRISELHSRLKSTLIELKDISDDLSVLASTPETNPARLEMIGERLDLLYSLQKKHRVNSVEELIDVRDNLQNKVDEINSYEFRIDEAKKKLDSDTELLARLSANLTESRINAISPLEEHMVSLLIQLGIANAQFSVYHERLTGFTREGLDKVAFMFSANPQSPVAELSRIASGGEISRVMLSLKSLIARSSSLPTIIFDEIDSGVSGEVAGKMGNIMKNMSGNMQVINITHLPQIAGKGDHQFHVYKEDTGSATYTRIRLLSRQERIREIARMISNDGLTEAALLNAGELLCD
jgi:DNA repair protein RecN (Recombination protein N)